MLQNMQNNIVGRIKITDLDTKDVLVEKNNAVNFENMSITIVRALGGMPEGHITEMHFGNGGSIVSGTGGITYFPPNVNGLDAELYNPTYFKTIDPRNARNADPSRNNFEIRHVSNTLFSDIVITATLDFNEPSGQDSFDDALNDDGDFVFDELGLKAFAPVQGEGLLLTHVVFNPIQKSLNRRIEVEYTLRVTMC